MSVIQVFVTSICMDLCRLALFYYDSVPDQAVFPSCDSYNILAAPVDSDLDLVDLILNYTFPLALQLTRRHIRYIDTRSITQCESSNTTTMWFFHALSIWFG